MKGEMRTVSRSDLNEENLLRFVRDGWLPIPRSIIPPERKNFLWDTLNLQPYDPRLDYLGRLLDNLQSSVRRTISEWGHIENIDRVGVWLSGGVDSSTLLYLTCKILGSGKVRAYSVDFGSRNEVERAKLIADWCDVRLLIEQMTVDDNIKLTEEAVLNARGPVCTTHVLFISKLCSRDGTGKVLGALGLDELQGGYPAHVNASNEEFHEIETNLLWKCQSSYAWAQQVQSKRCLEVKFPFLRGELVSWCRGLPRTQKCADRRTKARLRKELKARSVIPRRISEAGKIAGTKEGFCPILERWFEHNLGEWCDKNLPPNGLTSKATLRIERMAKGHLWRKWRAATINTFLRLLDEGEFNYKE